MSSIFKGLKSSAETVLALGGLPLAGAIGVFGYHKFEEHLENNYGPEIKPRYLPGQTIQKDGREYKVVGYSGHPGEIAKNLDMKRGVWITNKVSEAQRYAKNHGMVATIASRNTNLGSSRYENMHAVHAPREEDDYRVVELQKMTFDTDFRMSACFNRWVKSFRK